MRRSSASNMAGRQYSSAASTSARRPRSSASVLSSGGASVSTYQTDVDYNDDYNDMPMMEASMTCMSVVEEGSQIAFACYNEETNDILLEQSYANGHDTEQVVERFLAVARPNLILVGNNIVANEGLLYVLTRPAALVQEESLGQEGSTNGQQSNASTSRRSERDRATPYRLLKTSAFDVRRCRSLILEKLRVLSLLRRQQASRTQNSGGDPNRERRFQNAPWSGQQVFGVSAYHSLASIIDFDSSVQVRALGSLLSFLQSTIFRLEEGETVTVNSINQAKTAMFMRINASTLRALHIFSTEHHPLMAKGYGHTKEGFSLFTLLDRTKSKVGRQRLKEWMLKPLLDRNEILRRQDGVELFLRPEFQTSVGSLLNLLERIGPVDRILLRMLKCNAAPMDYVVLSRTLSSALAITDLLTNEFLGKLAAVVDSQEGEVDANLRDAAARYVAFLEKIVQDCCVSVMRDLEERITSIVDEALTIEEKDTVVIQTGFHEDLDAAKHTFQNLDEPLTRIANETFERHPELKQVDAFFLPQFGFLIRLDRRQHKYSEATQQFEELPPDFNCIFVQDDDAYFKNAEAASLDDRLGDLDAYIKDTESMIVSELEEDVLDCESDLRATFGALAELDCILSFANCASDLDFVRPNVIDASETAIEITNGRHPLQELIIDTEFIANDTHIDSQHRLHVVTGPNYSGKSCYTRQVGMLVYMAHIGCFLPCESAIISITDQILARINTVETCTVPQSSFQLDLTQMGTILRRSTPHSLVLIDEFGKGTNPASGIAVLTAALQKLARLQCKVICTTHFLETFSLGLLRNGVGGIQAHRMAIHLPDSNEEDAATPLFKLENGVASSSAGLVCARAAGVNKRVVNRAKDIIGALREGTQVPPISVSKATPLTAPSKEAVGSFMEVDSWTNASEHDIRSILQRLSRIR